MWCKHSTSQDCAKTFIKNGVAGGLVGPELRQGGNLEENWVVLGVRFILGSYFGVNQYFGGDISPNIRVPLGVTLHPGSFCGRLNPGSFWGAQNPGSFWVLNRVAKSRSLFGFKSGF